MPIIWLQKLPQNSLLSRLHTMSEDCSRDRRLQKQNKSFRNKVTCFLNQITFTVYAEQIPLIGSKSGIRLVLQNLTHMKEGLVFERFPELDAKSSFFSRPLVSTNEECTRKRLGRNSHSRSSFEKGLFQKATTRVALWPSVKNTNRQIQSLANTACLRVTKLRPPFQV